jgi:poly-gamma-glutamate capsule biosynthesis protein CapA/YwtB (metallophosphatase superfamily)
MKYMPCGTPVTLFLCGDAMTARGIDQILAHPNAPGIQEPYVRDAREYVELAERANGPIARPVPDTYIWGDALEELERVAPDVRIINLETSVTSHDKYSPGKAIHYRMHPLNVDCLTVACINICALANNHVMDYGYDGLKETLRTLSGAGIEVAGAGINLGEARRPAIIDLPDDRRVVLFSIGFESSGIPPSWAAGSDTPGVDWLPDLSGATADAFLSRVQQVKRAGDVVVASIHWGSNWGYEIPESHSCFAHRLLDGNVDLIHGHSSHHPRPIEVYREKLVLYGCGDFITDYEGISGYEEVRDDLVLMYFPRIDPVTGYLLTLYMAQLRIRRLQLVYASQEEAEWLRARLALVSHEFGSDFEVTGEGRLVLHQRVHRGPDTDHHIAAQVGVGLDRPRQ